MCRDLKQFCEVSNIPAALQPRYQFDAVGTVTATTRILSLTNTVMRYENKAHLGQRREKEKSSLLAQAEEKKGEGDAEDASGGGEGEEEANSTNEGKEKTFVRRDQLHGRKSLAHVVFVHVRVGPRRSCHVHCTV